MAPLRYSVALSLLTTVSHAQIQRRGYAVPFEVNGFTTTLTLPDPEGSAAAQPIVLLPVDSDEEFPLQAPVQPIRANDAFSDWAVEADTFFPNTVKVAAVVDAGTFTSTLTIPVPLPPATGAATPDAISVLIEALEGYSIAVTALDPRSPTPPPTYAINPTLPGVGASVTPPPRPTRPVSSAASSPPAAVSTIVIGGSTIGTVVVGGSTAMVPIATIVTGGSTAVVPVTTIVSGGSAVVVPIATTAANPLPAPSSAASGDASANPAASSNGPSIIGTASGGATTAVYLPTTLLVAPSIASSRAPSAPSSRPGSSPTDTDATQGSGDAPSETIIAPVPTAANSATPSRPAAVILLICSGLLAFTVAFL